MPDDVSAKIRDGFAWQIAHCRQMGSDLTADVLAAFLGIVDRSTRTGARILDWQGDPKVDALKLRIAGGLNALARSGQDADLSALYATRAGDFSGVLRRVLAQWDDWLYPWLDSAPQTNEVARSGVLYPGLMEIAQGFGAKLELLELGASAGLNLHLDRYAYRLGEIEAGDPSSPVRLSPQWCGASPKPQAVEIVSRAGVDLNPLNLGDDAVVERLMAYVWPDQTERVTRAEAAIDLARAHPVSIDAGDGADWIEAKLKTPQPEGVTRVIYHSIALQYFPKDAQARAAGAIKAAGARASEKRPIAWLSMEFPEMNAPIELSLRCWPGDGERALLATCHPHGAWVDWLA